MRVCGGRLEIGDEQDSDGDIEITIPADYNEEERTLYLSSDEAVSLIEHLERVLG